MIQPKLEAFCEWMQEHLNGTGFLIRVYECAWGYQNVIVLGDDVEAGDFKALVALADSVGGTIYYKDGNIKLLFDDILPGRTK